MTLLLGQHNEAVAGWVGAQLGCTFTPPFTTIARLAPDGTLIGAAVFTGFTGPNIDLTMHAPGPAFGRQFLRAVLRYPFDDLGALRMTAQTRRSNKNAAGQLRRIATFEGVQRRFYGPRKADDAFLFGIFPDHPLVRRCRQ